MRCKSLFLNGLTGRITGFQIDPPPWGDAPIAERANWPKIKRIEGPMEVWKYLSCDNLYLDSGEDY